MFDKIEPEKARVLIETNLEYLSIIDALRLLESRNLTDISEEEKTRNSEIAGALNKLKEKTLEYKNEIERDAMSNLINTNFVPLIDGWYAIAFFSDKKHSLRKLYFALLSPDSDFDAIEKHVNKYDNEHPKSFLNPFLDIERFGPVHYKERAMAQSLAEGGEIGEIAYMSEHAKQRYEQRAGNPADIPDASDDLKAAELVYEQDATGTKYYLNKDSMLFYCVKNDVVVTCYRHDFGFNSSEIDAKIVLMLIDKLNETKAKCVEKTNGIKRQREEIENRKRQVEAELASINQKRRDLLNAAKKKKKEIKDMEWKQSNCDAAIASVADGLWHEEMLLLTDVKVKPAQ